MAYRKFLILCFLPVSGAVFAGYAQLAPPPGWSQGSSGINFYAKAANEKWLQSTVRTNAALNVGGRSVVMPASMRLAANAPRVIAAAISMHPAVRTAVGIATLLSAAGIIYDVSSGWAEINKSITCANGVCNQYALPGVAATATWGTMLSTATLWASIRQQTNPQFRYVGRVAGAQVCADGYGGAGQLVGTDCTGVMTRVVPESESAVVKPLTPAEVEEIVLPRLLPMPQTIPDELPLGTPLPVEQPILNPSADPVPVPQPMRLPQGEPQVVPGSNPQQWRTPVVDVVPAPSPSSPWRVDIQPKDIIKLSPSPLPDVAPVPVTPPAGESATPKDEAPDLCAAYPDILACAKPEFDTPSTPELDTKPRELVYTPDSGWGSGGACPAPRHLPGANVDFEFTLVCDFMSGIKPVLLTVASLMGGMIIIGARGGAAE